MQTVDNGDGTYTHTITANDIVVTDLFRMALAYGRRPVTHRPQVTRQWQTRANDGPWIHRRRVIAGRAQWIVKN